MQTNPFSLTTQTPLIGYQSERVRLLLALRTGAQFLAVRGPRGSGKTTLLKALARELAHPLPDASGARPPATRACYLPKLPHASEWSLVFDALFPRRSLFRKPQSPAQLALSLPARAQGRAVLCIDEADAAAPEDLALLRSFTDAAPQLSVLFAASSEWLPPAPIADRLECAVALTGLEPASFRELIRGRVRHAGGSDIEPFTSEALLAIHRETRGLPLAALRRCSVLWAEAQERNLTAIDPAFFIPSFDARGAKNPEPFGAGPSDGLPTFGRSQARADTALVYQEAEEPPRLPFRLEVDVPRSFLPLSLVQSRALPGKQRQLLDTLAVVGPLTPTELAALADAGYKDKATAIRAANNLLVRLHKAGLVARAREGRAYRYAIAIPSHA